MRSIGQLVRSKVLSELKGIQEYPYLIKWPISPTGEKFICLINGHIHEEGIDDIVPVMGRDKATDSTVTGIINYAKHKIGSNYVQSFIIYWRVFPELKESETGCLLRTRLLITNHSQYLDIPCGDELRYKE